MTKLECKRCGYKWEYNGKRKFYTSCPDCKTSVKITPPTTRIRSSRKEDV